ncbi:DUF7344 domain-containing protein [Halosolutus halophilus]|uniref:DUF7344 domain-containing protein n=1 Tax=Halosolutus halophilus TaxID=1552990 RepID=UPI0022350AB8|nr:hypothetical protein [Halosolutus halophilus]
MLDVLMNSNTPVEIGELVATVAAQEKEADVANEETVERVSVTLLHVHLPMMAELGVIEVVSDPNRA